jgi:branched-chain amino acid transporter
MPSARTSLYKGMKDGLPVALGYLSVSLAFGMLSVKKGLPAWVPITISLTNLTGTGQLAGMELMAVHASLLEIAFTVLIINLRYILMSLSWSQRITPDLSFGKRCLIAFGNTDEIFAVSMQQKGTLSFPYLMGLILTPYISWGSGTALGALISNSLPESIRIALGIALYAMFIAVIVPPSRKSKRVLAVVILSILLSCLLHFLPAVQNMGSGWIIIICGLVASAVGAKWFPLSEEDDR